MLLAQKIQEAEKEIGLTQLSRKTGISKSVLSRIKNKKLKKYRKSTIDILYKHFGLEKDSFYFQNMKKRYNPTFSVIGNILREKRIQRGLTLDEVAWLLKGDKRQLQRIEHGKSLSAYRSYYMSQLLILYDFTPEEKEQIRRGIKILKDLLKMQRELNCKT